MLRIDAPFATNFLRAKQCESAFFDIRLESRVDMELGTDNLQNVLIVCGNHHIGTITARGGSVGRDKIVGFGILEFHAAYPKKRNVFLEPFFLRTQIVRHRGAVLFISGLQLHAARRQSTIPDHSGPVGLQIREHLTDGLDEPIDRIRRLATGIS